jgi:hypothetical protein
MLSWTSAVQLHCTYRNLLDLVFANLYDVTIAICDVDLVVSDINFLRVLIFIYFLTSFSLSPYCSFRNYAMLYEILSSYDWSCV